MRRYRWAALLALPLLAGCMSSAPVSAPSPKAVVATPTLSASTSKSPNRGAMTQEQLDRYTELLTCVYIPGVGHVTADLSKPCYTQGKKKKQKNPSWKEASGGSCEGYRGEGPYDFLLSDGTSRQAYGLTCREALREAKRSMPPGVFVVEVIPL